MNILMGKVRTVNNPYNVVHEYGWTWYILKHYQSPEKEKQNPYASVFCFVTSPYCPEGEYGDVYLSDIGAQP